MTTAAKPLPAAHYKEGTVEELIRELLERYEWAVQAYLILQFVGAAMVILLVGWLFVTLLRDWDKW